jgi:para-nitrobenzyl esterase
VDTIKTENGYISGTVLGEPGNEVHVYRGIPYAAPPVGDLRWKPPQAVTPWPGIRECTTFSLQPAQFPDVNMPIEVQQLPSSEDCLYLNVLTPAKAASDKLPVMVWLHGGGLRYGSGNSSLCNSLGLPQHGVVLVTVNSRLGVLGLMAHPLLSNESPEGVSGNYMFLDIMAALKWVKRNIAAFGGDSDNVTIFGESGGVIKVISLMASPLAKGLFHRAICESGDSGSTLTMKQMEGFGEKLFTRLGIDKEKDPLAAVRALPWKKIIEVDQALNVEMAQEKDPWFVFLGPWTVTVDGWFMPDTAPNIFKAGKQTTVPFIMSANLGELTGPGYVDKPEWIPEYVKLLSGASKANTSAYAVIFDHIPINWRQEGSVSAHAMEMHYVFGALDDSDAWNTHLLLYNKAGVKSPVPLITDVDRKVSEEMMTMWTQFAKTGNPSVKGLIEWPAYDENTDQYLYIAESLQVKSGFSKIAQNRR